MLGDSIIIISSFHSSFLCIYNSQNILLDDTLQPKVADFGFLMALPLDHGSSCVVTGGGALALTGTRGYLAPEFTSGKLGAKSDVYSYGIVGLSLPLDLCNRMSLRLYWRHTRGNLRTRRREKMKIW